MKSFLIATILTCTFSAHAYVNGDVLICTVSTHNDHRLNPSTGDIEFIGEIKVDNIEVVVGEKQKLVKPTRTSFPNAGVLISASIGDMRSREYNGALRVVAKLYRDISSYSAQHGDEEHVSVSAAAMIDNGPIASLSWFEKRGALIECKIKS